ncbi:MAG: PQQ-dependent sugar dehydrogenase [Actinobacteria bacterium]|nr:PQQ-dependent sugar dehydrogenase [Actinomycetota bacterium]
MADTVAARTEPAGGGGTWRGILAAATLALVASAVTAIVGDGSTARAASIHARRIAGGLNAPVAFTFTPGGRIFYVEKTTGEIHILNPTTGRTALFFDVPGVNGDGERGMLGIALHPAFPHKPFVYVYATRVVNGHLRNQILRLTDVNGKGRRLRLLWSARASSNPYHNGGRILFGPDRKLYAVVGDAHDSSNSQDLTRNDRGKILRMTPSGGVPSGNPIPNSLIYAYGIRNSFGFAFDPQTGSLWETENGPECNDEVNLITAGSNYGWGPNETCSGTHPDDTNQDGPSPVFPSLFFLGTIGITGDAVCDGCHLNAASEGGLFWGSYNNGNVYRVDLNGTRDDTVNSTRTVVMTHSGSVLSMEVGPGGSIYFSDFSGIYRLVTG